MDGVKPSEMANETGEKFRTTSMLLKRVREMVKFSFGGPKSRAKEMIDAAAADVESGKVDLEK